MVGGELQNLKNKRDASNVADAIVFLLVAHEATLKMVFIHNTANDE
jgi:hypothetical protein